MATEELVEAQGDFLAAVKEGVDSIGDIKNIAEVVKKGGGAGLDLGSAIHQLAEFTNDKKPFIERLTGVLKAGVYGVTTLATAAENVKNLNKKKGKKAKD